MYYAIRKTGPVIQVARGAGSLAVFAATGAWGQDKPIPRGDIARCIRVTKSAKAMWWRFLPAACSYGYTLVADELRYNHATQVASASGKITLTSLAMNLQCETVTLDGAHHIVC